MEKEQAFNHEPVSQEQPESGEEEELRVRFFPGAKVKVMRHKTEVLEEGWEVVMFVRNIKNELCATVYNREKDIRKSVTLKDLAKYN